jgi:hypothetical protein
MNIRTLEYLINFNSHHSLIGPFHYSDLNNCALSGHPIQIDNNLFPTIMKGEWVLPKTKFITYEYHKDLEWCKYFGIGHVSEEYIEGEVYMDNMPIRIFKNNKPKRSFCYNPMDRNFKKQRGMI